MKNDEKPIVNPYVMLREEFDDWAILFNPDTGRGFGLSPTGVYVWKLLDGEHTIDDMRETLRRDADDVPAEAGEHCIAFVKELTQHGLAGYDVAFAREHRRPEAACTTANETMHLTYEPPKLVDLSGRATTRGGACGPDCYPGTSATDGCSGGGAPVGSCIAYGACATNCHTVGVTTEAQCNCGTSAGYYPDCYCHDGTNPCINWCGGGSSVVPGPCCGGTGAQ